MIRFLLIALLSALAAPSPTFAEGADAGQALRRFLEDASSLRAHFVQSVYSTEMPEPQVSEGVLMINCRQDEIVPRASAERYWDALGRPEILWYDGGHYALKNHVFDVLGRITAHFVR